ncbi:MAG: GAF domain-containing protein [Candidatus Zixiibacteriota bacterium]|nr:MAG: GAF domain-containing protein [candidate division Zixibacteria bacterium]
MASKTEKIIIVDDEKRMCESLSALLNDEGYDVQGYQDPAEAAQVIRTSRVDLVITDIKMPGVDGLELLQIVKQVDLDIPVILMTGYASLESAVEAISRGAYDYLLKPVEFTQLDLAVRRALDKRRSDLARLRILEELKISNLILHRRISELNALYEAGKSIGSTANPQELLRQIVALASNVTEAQVGSIMLLDEDGEYLTIEAAIGLEEKIIETTRLPIGESIAGSVAQQGRPLMVENVEEDDRFKRINKERYGAASLLCCPLKIKNRVIGVINMANKQGGEGFTKDDLRLLTTFASQAAIAVDDANQFEKNRRRLTEFQILHEITTELAQIQSLADFHERLIDKLSRVFPIDYSILFTWDDLKNVLVADGVSGVADIPLTRSGKIDLTKIPVEKIIFRFADGDEDKFADIGGLTSAIGEKMNESQVFPSPANAHMAIPVFKYGNLAYVFYLGTDAQRKFSDEDISLARLVISQAAILFEKERALLNATRLLTMGNMISEISHDLRRPLTSIKGGLQIIGQRWPDVMENSQFLKDVQDEVHRMNELVRELVDFSNPNKYQTEKVDLRQVVERARELVDADLRKSKVKFEANYEDADWNVIVNKNQIMEAFLNLFINAVDAMPDGGVLSVHGLTETPEHKKQEYLAVRVTDTGVGIKKENLSKVFDRYYTTKETGTGLGLAVVERIISAHNGTLRAESEEGKGSTFILYFPIEMAS